MAGVYFDSSVFVAIFKPEKQRASHTKALLQELARQKARIHTSIIAVQECSVIAFKRGTVPRDYHAQISKLAEVHTVTLQIATTSAKHEAFLIDKLPPAEQNKPRRKWDCFHIATAQALNCKTLYTWDKPMLDRKQQLQIKNLDFDFPMPRTPDLFQAKKRKRQNPNQLTIAEAATTK